MNASHRLQFVDFAKGYAICTILLFHALQRMSLPDNMQKAIIFGGTGVHLFFLLSGFGLNLSDTLPGITDFYRRRFSKIWLPYAIALTISLGTALAFNLFPDRWDAWMAGIGLYQMFSADWMESFGGHFWFISTIIQFYLIFPLLQRIQRGIGYSAAWLLLTLFVSVAWWLIVYLLQKGGLRNWNSCFLQFLWEFALGMALASVVKGRYPAADWLNRTTKRLSGWWQDRYWWVWLGTGLFFSGIMLALIIGLGEGGRIFNDIPALLGYTGICAGMYWFSAHFWSAINRFFLWVNGFSYSLYLVHILILESTLKLSGGILSVILLPVFVLLALLAGWLFERFTKRLV